MTKALYKGRRGMRNTLTYGRIVSNIPEMAIRRGFGFKDGSAYAGKVNIQRLHRASDISRATLYYMLRHPETFTQMDFNTIAKLCFALDCQPGDLLKYERFADDRSTPIGQQRPTALNDLPGVE